ncbi:MAG: hypothetical protein ACOYW7_05375 [Nitrospirota bacterium]
MGNGLPEGYQQVAEDFYKYVREQYKGDVLEIFDELRGNIKAVSIREGIDSDEFRERLNQSEYVRSQIYHALNTYARTEKETFFPIPYNVDLNLHKNEWDDVSPVDRRDLENAATEYLKRPWMQSAKMDWYLLNGFIFDEFARYRDELVSGRLLAEYGDVYYNFIRHFIDAKGDGSLMMKQTMYRLAWSAGINAIRWVAFPLVIYLLYAYEYEKAAAWIGVPYLIYIAFYILAFPFRFRRKRLRNKKVKEVTELDERLARLYHCCRTKTINPTILKEMVQDAERNKIVISPVVHSVLDRAIQRDPAVLAR